MLKETEFISAAALIGIDPERIMVVADVESAGNGFLQSGQLRILFEPHIFFRELNDAGIDPAPYAAINKFHDIVYEAQGSQPYGSFAFQWDKLRRASQIHREAAYKATSWGKFQPLGKYFAECGYQSVFDMVADFEKGEYQQLIGFVKMIQSRGLVDVLQKKKWNEFKVKYNGPAKNNYVEKLIKADKKYSK